MLYRIFTENKNQKTIVKFIREHFPDFTMIECIGYWRGYREKSLCIEIVGSKSGDMVYITRLCWAICGYNKQQSVLVQKIDVNSVLIELSGITEL